MRILFRSFAWRCLAVGLLAAVATVSLGGDSTLVEGVTEDSSEVRPTTQPDVDASSGSPEEIERLVRQLGDPRFERRQEAEDALAKLGLAASDALRAAADDADLEIATRARHLLRLMQVELSRPGDPAEVASLLAHFHLLDERGQVARLKKLAALDDGAGIAALCRVIRFEPSIVLAKQAAVALLTHYPSDQVPMDRLAGLLRENLRDSPRLPSRWMLSYAKFHDAPDDAWREWARWTKQEIELAGQQDQETDPRIVSELASQRVNWATRIGGGPQRMADAIQVLFELGGRREKDARGLIAWLVDEKAWEALGASPLALAKRLAAEPRSLVYGLAEKYAEQGKTAQAETAAEKAFDLEDDALEANPRFRFYLALQLQQDGHFRWAEREFRHVMTSGEAEDSTVADAHEALALMLHDQAENLRAADVLEKYLAALKKGGDAPKDPRDPMGIGSTPKELMARMDYYLACHWRDAGDRANQRLAIEAGLALDPANSELLIAAYRLPDVDPLFRNKVRKLVRNASVKTRVKMLSSSNRPNACNELAWLIANTEGDFDEAIRLSRESLVGQTDNGAYLDTLAHCYFAKGDYEKAVKYQIKAAELEPHCGLIAKQLGEFRRAYEEKLGKPAPKPGPTKKKSQGPRLIDPSGAPSFEEEERLVPLLVPPIMGGDG